MLSPMSSDVRTARLLFDDALTAGRATEAQITQPDVLRALRVRIPPRPVREAERVAIKLGRREPETVTVRRLEELRRTVLGDDAAGPPRFLVRQDEFPHWLAADLPEKFGTENFERFHDVMASAGVPYLTAVVPHPAPNPNDPDDTRRRELDDREREVLARLPGEGVEFAMHGLDHRTRDRNPRKQAELLGLDDDALAARLDEGLERLRALSIDTQILVPPWNRFAASQWDVLASRFRVITGGPETVRLLGLQAGPVWLRDAVYLPAYEPFYAGASVVTEPARAAVERQGGTWIPIVLHWGWELEDGFESLRRLCDVIAPHTARWADLLDAAERSGQTDDARRTAA